MVNFIYKFGIIALVCAIYLFNSRETEFDQDELFGKNVLVTGASSGIGEHMAYEYARMGANVFITARRENLLQKVVSECKRIGRKDAVFGYVVADMANFKESSQTVVKAALRTLGSLDHVVINHAILPEFMRASWHGDDHDLQFLAKSVDVNFLSFVHLASHVIPHLKKSDHGRLGIVSSMAGKIEMIGGAPYSATKFALDGFFSSLRAELSMEKSNVTVTVCPIGFIATEEGLRNNARMFEVLRIDGEKMRSVATWADVRETALGIIQAVCLGHREFYYPPFFGLNTRILPILRHLAPSLLDPELKGFRKSD